MRSRFVRLTRALTLAAVAGLLVFPGSAAATTNEPIAQTGGATVTLPLTLPLLGTSLTVDVVLDDTGNISGVTLTPPTSFTQTTTEPTRVKFENADGTTKVSVKAKGSKLAVNAKTGLLAQLTGKGSWQADVFGTAAKSSVGYAIGDDGKGNPTLAIGPVSAAGGITATVKTPVTKSNDKRAYATGGVTFASGGYVKRLTITVSVNKETGKANLAVTLSGKDRMRMSGTLAQLTGPRTWSAHLCDGTLVTVNYHVGPGAEAVFDSASGAPVTSKKLGKGFWAKVNGSWVGVLVTLRENKDGTYTLRAAGFSGKCKSANASAKRDGHGGFTLSSFRRDDDNDHKRWGRD
jgi:hypothetical protein